jgi:CO dehydrogenase/acetyl-CoA synthase beta subunit
VDLPVELGQPNRRPFQSSDLVFGFHPVTTWGRGEEDDDDEEEEEEDEEDCEEEEDDDDNDTMVVMMMMMMMMMSRMRRSRFTKSLVLTSAVRGMQ